GGELLEHGLGQTDRAELRQQRGGIELPGVAAPDMVTDRAHDAAQAVHPPERKRLRERECLGERAYAGSHRVLEHLLLGERDLVAADGELYDLAKHIGVARLREELEYVAL